jgi:hypothetical protein
VKARLSGCFDEKCLAVGWDEMAIANHFTDSASPPVQRRISLAGFRCGNRANNAEGLSGQALPAERFRHWRQWPGRGLCKLHEPPWGGCDWALSDDAINMAVWVDAGRGDNATAVPSDIDARRDARL